MILKDVETNKLYELKEIDQEPPLNVAWVIGHCDSEEGAVFSGAIGEDEETMCFSEALNESEFDLWSVFAERNLSDMGTVFHHESLSSYGKRQYATAQKTKDFELAFELHFNAGAESAEGSEALYYHGNEKTRLICEKFAELMHEKMGYKKRSAKPLTETSRGYGFVSMQKPPAIILEPFFGSNKEDCLRFDEVKFKEVLKELVVYAKTVL